MIEHDGTCIGCGKLIPCLEAECTEPPGHDYWCKDCLEKKIKKPDSFDLACERRYDYAYEIDYSEPAL